MKHEIVSVNREVRAMPEVDGDRMQAEWHGGPYLMKNVEREVYVIRCSCGEDGFAYQESDAQSVFDAHLANLKPDEPRRALRWWEPKWKIVSFSTDPQDAPGWYTTSTHNNAFRTRKAATQAKRFMDMFSGGRHWRHEVKPIDFPDWKRP